MTTTVTLQRVQLVLGHMGLDGRYLHNLMAFGVGVCTGQLCSTARALARLAFMYLVHVSHGHESALVFRMAGLSPWWSARALTFSLGLAGLAGFSPLGR